MNFKISLEKHLRKYYACMFALTFVQDIIIFFTEMRSVLSWRWCTGHREDNGRQIHEGHRRLHQRPCIGLGLLGRPVVARAGDQHALVHPMKERYPCRPTSGSGVVGSIPKLGYENLRITNRIAAKWIARKSAPRESASVSFAHPARGSSLLYRLILPRVELSRRWGSSRSTTDRSSCECHRVVHI